ncbi:putative 5-3 exonuclease [Trypanosoma melophagium]|uniref:putative 5-3 exonuclease n=1 Tax=Trypanosoma melophagium TaxID=715481 RepID=UPI00351A1967|nr:putative 5-3 exonuclease [Trypanosoma melophagium]
MGTKGLWSYLNHHGLISQPRRSKGQEPIIEPHHLLLDMNAIVHSVIKNNNFTSRKIIEELIVSIKRILMLCPPTETFALVFDGSAPIAKLPLQKERRAAMKSPKLALQPSNSKTGSKYNHDYLETEVKLQREEILTGSEFLLACEDAVRSALNLANTNGQSLELKPDCTIIFSGCTEAGEGELKISSILREIWIKQEETNKYTGEDIIVVIGNDSDLALIGIACTPYKSYYLVDPIDFAITAIGELLEHWIRSVPNGRLPLELLPSYRIDFLFLTLLSGGDWFEGIANSSRQLWRKYRDLRLNGGYYRRSLISGEHFDIDVELLRAVMDVKTSIYSNGRLSKIKQITMRKVSPLPPAAVEGGVELLKGAMWALKSIAGGQCFDYNFRVQPKDPTLGMLKAAAYKKGVADSIRPVSTSPIPLYSPLEQCLAVMGKRGRYSAEMIRALTTVSENGGEKLTLSRSTSYLLTQIRLIMAEVDTTKLSLAENELLKTQHRAPSVDGDKKYPSITFMSYKYSSLQAENRDNKETNIND